MYEDETGKTRIWEAVSHTNRPRICAVDAVQVVAILEKSTGPELLLEKQFRPPVGKVVVQFPAGFIGEGETPDQAAVRELKEETGYIGDVIQNTKERRPILYPCKYNPLTSLLSASQILTY
jgi:ADP-ribose pyrophosphatase